MVLMKAVKESKDHCKAHTLPQHDIFLNYRKTSEGTQAKQSSVSIYSFLFLFSFCNLFVILLGTFKWHCADAV
jgi:hypothetical protein